MNKNNKLEKFRQRKAQEFFTQELPEDDADILCENEEKPLASEVIADQQEEIENLKAELQETKKKRDFWHSYASNQLRKLDIINFIIQLYSEKTINFLYGVAKSSFQNQKEQEQEEENRWKDVY